ncbi:MAG: plastocyanin/azurin family copper-binding protein [bacterium]
MTRLGIGGKSPASAAKTSSSKASAPKAKPQKKAAGPKGKGKKPAPNLEERMEGVQGWMAEIEKRQRLMTYIGGGLAAAAIILGIAALTLALINNSNGATQEDVDEINARLDVIQTEVKSATEEQLQSVSDSLTDLQSRVDALEQSPSGTKGKKGTKDSGASGGAPQQKSSTQVGVDSPKSGALRYSPSTLRTPAGELTITYLNPSPVPHNLAISRNGKVLGKTKVLTKGSASVTIGVSAGQYVFYCTVPGHRQAGMQGDLIVGG